MRWCLLKSRGWNPIKLVQATTKRLVAFSSQEEDTLSHFGKVDYMAERVFCTVTGESKRTEKAGFYQ